MEYFVAVAERGSITAAAAELPISESAVSVAISELESIVGVRLLHRVRARGVSLTAAGSALLPELRSLVARARELERNAADLGSAVTGELRVALDPVLTPVLLPRLMCDSYAVIPQSTSASWRARTARCRTGSFRVNAT